MSSTFKEKLVDVMVVRKEVRQEGTVTTSRYPDIPPMSLEDIIKFDRWVDEQVNLGNLELEVLSLTPKREAQASLFYGKLY